MVQVTPVDSVDDEMAAAVARLVPQLSRSSPPPSRADLEALVASPATVLFAARNTDGPVIGILTLATFRIPTGMRAWIEDVVVDESARGTGAARALTEAALAVAEARGARTVELTSRPERQAANRLYQSMGFVSRETNVYRRVL